MDKPELVSFAICPFVQRSVITLLQKGVDYDVTFIDLKNKPQWFLEISPLGKVPVLRAEGRVLFESAVICEYLDEAYEPRLHPAAPVDRAHNRAWIEFGSGLLVALYQYTAAKDEAGAKRSWAELDGKLDSLEDELGEGPFFNGADFSLVDAAYAPFFQRLALAHAQGGDDLLADRPRTRGWSETLLAQDVVKRSVVPDLAERYAAHFRREGSWLFSE